MPSLPISRRRTVGNEPGLSAVTCRLCDPPEVVGDGLMDHLRLFHPDYHDSLTAPPGPVQPDPAPDAPVKYPVVHPLDIERGAVCMDCDRPFRPSDRYGTRLIGLVGHVPMTEVVCLTCAGAS